MTIILFNSLGLEIDRKKVNFKSEIMQVINSWVINDGDTIKFDGVCIDDSCDSLIGE